MVAHSRPVRPPRAYPRGQWPIEIPSTTRASPSSATAASPRCPRGPRFRHAALTILAERFAPGRTYAESEVNAVLAEDAPDHATLRRLLVDEGFLLRERGVYRRIDATDVPHR
ncbi:MAG TPA: DUF2087 domain-containing protein [Candidatus Limnocylindria bacterium]